MRESRSLLVGLCLCLGGLPGFADSCSGDLLSCMREVRVRQTPAGPATFVDGKPVAAHMFWGRENMRALPVGSQWREFSVPIQTNVTVNGGFVLFQFQKGAGRLDVRNFRI